MVAVHRHIGASGVYLAWCMGETLCPAMDVAMSGSSGRPSSWEFFGSSELAITTRSSTSQT